MANTFSLILVIVTLVTGIVWALDKWIWAKQRQQKIAEVRAQTNDIDVETAETAFPQPWWVENCVSIFPVITVVLVIRSFIFEPFQIPSGSMKPTLLVGDFILVQKFSYGIKDPVFNKTIIETGQPQRGDIAVFRYPVNPKIDFIKRVVGLPGDIVRYSENKVLCIQPKGEATCQPVAMTNKQVSQIQSVGGMPLLQFDEKLGSVEHQILINPWRPVMPQNYQPRPGVSEWIVPKGHYFMMGDNRDNSEDSRYWGFVPEQNFVGKAVAIWISFKFERSPDSILPSWIPTGVRLNRIGSIH